MPSVSSRSTGLRVPRLRLCIDASNLRSGGGVTHLREVLRRGDPVAHRLDRVFVWAPRSTHAQIEDRDWLVKRTTTQLERHYLIRALWQRFSIGQLAVQDGCNLLFAPGGSFATPFRPVVTMSRNMLPFEAAESARYGLSAYRAKMHLLRWSQARSLRLADGRIFLTQYAHDTIDRIAGPFKGLTTIIPHGVDERFFFRPRPQRSIAACSPSDPFRLIYVSTVDAYKHQRRVAEAVARLRDQGLPVSLDFIGSAHVSAKNEFLATLERLDPGRLFLRYHGSVPYDILNVQYRVSDAAVFASSCENMPNILLEKMAAGLPIACANRGPMPAVLGDAGVYFDPENSLSLELALRQLLTDPDLRARLAQSAFQRAGAYTWSRCADATFEFLHRTAQEVAAAA